jgi:peroxiredoxin
VNPETSAGKHEEDSERPRGQGREVRVPLLIAGLLLVGAGLALVLYGTGYLQRDAKTSDVLEQVAPLPVGTPQMLEMQPETSAAGPELGSAAPSFALRDLDGQWASLADYEDRPLLINFWATWCGPCIVEMPELQAAYEQHQDDGLVILGMNRDEGINQIRDFFTTSLDTEITFPILLDEHGAIADRYQVYNLPTTFFVDRNGVIVAVHRGPLTQAQIEAYLDAM